MADAGAGSGKNAYFIIKRRRTTRIAGIRKTEKRYRLSEKAGKSIAAVRAHFRRQILTGPAIAAGKDGLYTWIYKGDSLIAGRARSEQELGTLHKNLDDLTDPGPVQAAGEFVKAGKHIAFNLQSGSYMKSAFTRLRAKAAKVAKREELVEFAVAAFARIGLAAAFHAAPAGSVLEEELAGAPLIDNAEIITTLSDAADYDRILSASSASS